MENGELAEVIRQRWKVDTALYTTAIGALGYILSGVILFTGHTLEGILVGTFTLGSNVTLAKISHYFRSKQAEHIAKYGI